MDIFVIESNERISMKGGTGTDCKSAPVGDSINWKDSVEPENQPEGNLSYLSVIETSDKKVHVVYSANRKWIRNVVIDL